MAATLKKLDWKTIIHKLVVQKNMIEAHLGKGGKLSELKNVKFIMPLSLPSNE